MTGEGDCTLADGGDNFLYIYCLRPSDWKITAARAPRGNIAPGHWMKWDGNGWRIPALDRAGAPLPGFPGHSAAFYTPRKAMLLLAVNKSLKLSLSSDKVNFTPLPAPLIIYDTDEWNRPAPDALYAYPSLVGEHGTNTIGERGWLTYAYVPPNEDFTQRYLIVHEIAIVAHAAPQSPQVRAALSRYKSAAGRLWATVAPAIEKRPNTFTHETLLGDVMTAPPVAPSETNRGMRERGLRHQGLSPDQPRLRGAVQAGAHRGLCLSRRAARHARALRLRRAPGAFSLRLDRRRIARASAPTRSG